MPLQDQAQHPSTATIVILQVLAGMVPVLNTLSLAVVAVLVFAAHAAHHDSYATAATVEDDMASRAAALSASRQLLGGQPISIDSSVVLLFMTDVEGGENSPCVRMVKRSLEFKGRALNFFVTGYYADHNGDNRVEELGYKESQWDKSFRPYTMEAVSRFSRGLAVRCDVAAQCASGHCCFWPLTSFTATCHV